MKTIAIDTETVYVKENHGENGTLVPQLVCFSTATDRETGLYTEDDIRKVLAPLLSNPAIRLVGHHIAFDMAVLCQAFPELRKLVIRAYDEDRVTDTLLREKLIDIASGAFSPEGYSLARVVEDYSGEHLEKEDTWRLFYGDLLGVPLESWPEEATAYAMKDAQVTLMVYEKQEAYDYLLKDQYRQSRASFWMYLMSAKGVMTDPEKVAELEKNVETSLDRDRDLLLSYGLIERVYK